VAARDDDAPRAFFIRAIVFVEGASRASCTAARLRERFVGDVSRASKTARRATNKERERRILSGAT